MPNTPEKRKRKQPSRITKSADKKSAKRDPRILDAIQKAISLDPVQLLAVILKLTLRSRITDDEVCKICFLYHDAISRIWLETGKQE
jgi:hypothetical protein